MVPGEPKDIKDCKDKKTSVFLQSFAAAFSAAGPGLGYHGEGVQRSCLRAYSLPRP